MPLPSKLAQAIFVGNLEDPDILGKVTIGRFRRSREFVLLP